jgi:predicted ester cyclase
MTTRTATSAATLLHQAFDAIDARDLDRLAGIWDEHSTDVFHAFDLTLTGEAALRASFQELFTALPDLEFVTEEVHVVSDEIAVGQWQMSGTFSGGPFQGIEPTGQRIRLQGVDIVRFEDGKVRHNDVYYDGLSFARQVGILPPTGSVADRAMTATFNIVTRARNAVRTLFSRYR